MELEFKVRYGPWALILGGSEGLGAEFARQLAQKGLHLILLARDKDQLEITAEDIRKKEAVSVITWEYDLAQPGLVPFIEKNLEGQEIAMLIYNAAYPLIGDFLEARPEQHRALIQINIQAPQEVTYHFAQQMKAKGRGGIILLSSLAGFYGTAKVSHYAASKAYNLILAEGLWEEMRKEGIDVLALCPGRTRTPGYESSQPKKIGSLQPPLMETSPVVKEALKVLGKKPSIISGPYNRWASAFMRLFLPRKKAVELISKNTREMYD
ncbi:MAG: SDR family NAD(P)-dependent oxidoreductase [Bacteroidota bacterium]